MLTKAIISGSGGQGVLSMGSTLATAAMLEGRYVTYLPSYGVEVRGGTANCAVAVSDEEIASPVASAPEYLVAMNQPSFARFHGILQAGGRVLGPVVVPGQQRPVGQRPQLDCVIRRPCSQQASIRAHGEPAAERCI